MTVALVERTPFTNSLQRGDTIGNCNGVVLGQDSNVPNGKIKVDVVPSTTKCIGCELSSLCDANCVTSQNS